ncbi:hypothetical protein AA21291_0479 [Swaminathania salitolerans LMG 21291]|uniref:Uncharacterized protein n=1 Tax=Swaminathania salitolerans TaxID=182838 RepID=A0A511BTP2_9PROT|nr:hypothetical protein AA21291_0479 [Swaminathania salitolerans LMG 21291]GEL01338.1 hypothetical protein SSA02_05010 [Swaminathania salitolerans]
MPRGLFRPAFLKALRIGALIVGIPVATGLVVAGALLWRLSQGPLDVTAIGNRWAPVAVQASSRPGHPAGRLVWQRLLLSWRPGLRHRHPEIVLDAEGVRILRQDGRAALTLGRMQVVALMAPLLRGAVVPTAIALHRGTIHLRRAADGSVDLDWPGAVSRPGGKSPVRLDRLGRIVASDVDVTLFDPQIGGRLLAHAGIVDLLRRSGASSLPATGDTGFALLSGGRWQGRVEGGIGRGGIGRTGMSLAPFRLTASSGTAPGVARDAASGSAPVAAPVALSGASSAVSSPGWSLDAGPLRPDMFGRFVPHAAAWHLPVTFHLELHPDRSPARHAPSGLSDGATALPPLSGVADVTFGAGTIDQKADRKDARETEEKARREDGRKPGGEIARKDGQGAGVTSGRPLVVAHGRIALGLAVRPGSGQVMLHRAEMTLRDDTGRETTYAAHGSLALDDPLHVRKISARVNATATALDLAHMGPIWPEAIMRGARRWVVRNMTEGMARGLDIGAELKSDSGWGGLRPVATRADLSVENAVVHWLRPVPPARDVSARFSFATPDTLRIRFLGGEQPVSDRKGAGILHLTGGEMLISDLFARDQIGKISLDLSGDLRNYIALLSQPRLHILSRHKLPFTDPSGAVTASATLTLPLSARISDDDLHLSARASFRDVALGNVVIGRGLEEARGLLTATERHLEIDGEGRLGGVPTKARIFENFRREPDGTRETIHAVSQFDRAALARARLGENAYFHGVAELVSDYRAGFDGRASLSLALDLRNAGLVIPVWRKEIGTPARATAHMALRSGEIVQLDHLLAEGPDLHIDGTGQVAAGSVKGMTLDAFRVGRSHGNATIVLPDAHERAISVTVRAATLDIAPLLHPGHLAPDIPVTSTLPSDSPDPSVSPGGHGAKASVSVPDRGGAAPWIVDIAADRLYYSDTRSFSGVTAHLEHRYQRLERGTFRARAPVGIALSLTPQREATSRGRPRHLAAQIDDLGAFLSETGLTDRLEGGRARIDGTVEDGGTGQVPPFRGLVSVSPFTFRQPPAALTAASHLAIFDWAQASSDRFAVRHLRLPVSVRRDVMTIHEGHLGNPALGATIEGKIGLGSGALDLRGTVVPVFGINAAPGRLPDIGKLFSPEKGGGFLAATFTVRGTAGDPQLSVNPFAMLLPGVMRQLAK